MHFFITISIGPSSSTPSRDWGSRTSLIKLIRSAHRASTLDRARIAALFRSVRRMVLRSRIMLRESDLRTLTSLTTFWPWYVLFLRMRWSPLAVDLVSNTNWYHFGGGFSFLFCSLFYRTTITTRISNTFIPATLELKVCDASFVAQIKYSLIRYLKLTLFIQLPFSVNTEKTLLLIRLSRIPTMAARMDLTSTLSKSLISLRCLSRESSAIIRYIFTISIYPFNATIIYLLLFEFFFFYACSVIPLMCW